MSYILDALQRAQAERGPAAASPQRGAPIPHSVVYGDSANTPSTARLSWRVPGLAAALLVAVAAVAVMAGARWSASSPASDRVTAAAPPAVAPPSVVPPPPVAPVAQQALPGPGAPLSAAGAPPFTPAPLSVNAPATMAPIASALSTAANANAGASAHAHADAHATATATAIASQTAIASITGSRSTPTPATALTAPATTGAAPAPPLLTASVKAAMPAIVFSGSTYSDNPAHRMWIANGQVFHEGEDIAPGVRLERIEPKSAVIRFQGHLYVWRD